MEILVLKTFKIALAVLEFTVKATISIKGIAKPLHGGTIGATEIEYLAGGCKHI